jgi:uncharacterized protein YkwD
MTFSPSAMKAAVICAVIVLASAATTAASSSPAEQQILDQLNMQRQKAGFAALAWNDQVAEAARRHSQTMAENGGISHQFTGEAALPERVAALGVRFTVSAENVARTEYVEDVHLALMNSPGHRANMLNPAYNAIGIGVVEHKGKIYVTQDFVYQVQEYSEAQFSTAFAEAYTANPKSRGGARIDSQPDPLLHDLACATDGDASKLSGRVEGTYLVVFNASEPRRLPQQLLDRAAESRSQRLSFGVCFRPDTEHGYANFWVVAAFDRR